MNDVASRPRSGVAPASPSPSPGGRHLKRLSLSTSSFSSPGSPASASSPPVARASTPTRSHQPRQLRLSLSGGSPLSYHSPDGSSPADSPTLRRGPSSAPAVRQNHSSRMSSISYSSASNSPSAPSFTTAATSPAVSLATVSPKLPPPINEEEGDESPVLPQDGFLSPARSGSAMGAQPTLTEAHSDLLSFIAKKERKCMDLREELKRHEAELSSLKKKWESIVAKSITPPPPPPAPTPAPYIPTRPMPAPQHTLDLSLLSSTFDPPQDDLDVEIGESVQAAKAWVGGVFGKVMGAVSGIEESVAPVPTMPALEILKEEEEEGGSASSKDTEEGKSWRDSQASVASDAVSDFGFSSSPKKGSPIAPLPSSNSSSSFDLAASVASPPPPRSASPPPPPASTPAPVVLAPAPSSAPAPAHNRRRSTFDLGWSSIGKRLAAVTESDTFKRTQRASMNLVDTFERTLTETLGPLDPPPAPERYSSRRGALVSPPLPLGATPTPAPGEKPKENWDWSASLEDPTQAVVGSPLEAPTPTPKVGGYKRPSLTSPLPPKLNGHAGSVASMTELKEEPEEADDGGWGW